MAFPTIVEVAGAGIDVSTWVADVFVPSVPEVHNMSALKVEMESKPYEFGLFSHGPQQFLMIIHCKTGKIFNENCKSLVNRLFAHTRINADIGQLAAFNGYHAEVMGFRPNPGPAMAAKEVPIELDSDDEEAIAEAWDVTKGRAELDRITQDYFAKKEQAAVALRPPPIQFGGAPDGPRVNWCTEVPAQLEVATQRALREWQKLQWVLFRSESTSMINSPTIKDFAGFYGIYVEISKVENNAKLLKQAFETFAGHVKKTTGNDVTKDQLPKEVLVMIHKIHNGEALAKKCECGKALKAGWEMDVDSVMMSASKFGMFCSLKCTKDRCKGCASTVEDGVCVKKCGDASGRSIRMATWGEYFEWMEKEARDPFEEAEVFREKAKKLTDAEKSQPKERLTWGGYFHVFPDAMM